MENKIEYDQSREIDLIAQKAEQVRGSTVFIVRQPAPYKDVCKGSYGYSYEEPDKDGCCNSFLEKLFCCTLCFSCINNCIFCLQLCC